jgi:hypothetical protein
LDRTAIPDPKLYYVISIFGGGAVQARTAMKRARDQIAAACDEIADRWPKIVEQLRAAEAVYPA